MPIYSKQTLKAVASKVSKIFKNILFKPMARDIWRGYAY